MDGRRQVGVRELGEKSQDFSESPHPQKVLRRGVPDRSPLFVRDFFPMECKFEREVRDMPASKPIPREADGTVDIKQARKRMAGHRTNAEIEAKAKSEVRAKEPKRITVPKYLPQVMEAEYRLTAKKLVALHIFSDLDYDMLAPHGRTPRTGRTVRSCRATPRRRAAGPRRRTFTLVSARAVRRRSV